MFGDNPSGWAFGRMDDPAMKHASPYAGLVGSLTPAELEDLSDAVEERRLRDETGFGTLAESESESSTPRRYSPILPIIYPL